MNFELFSSNDAFAREREGGIVSRWVENWIHHGEGKSNLRWKKCSEKLPAEFTIFYRRDVESQMSLIDQQLLPSRVERKSFLAILKPIIYDYCDCSIKTRHNSILFDRKSHNFSVPFEQKLFPRAFLSAPLDTFLASTRVLAVDCLTIFSAA